jgi:hypothetical protein
VTAEAAIDVVEALELIASLAAATLSVRPDASEIGPALAQRHFGRKHGEHA